MGLDAILQATGVMPDVYTGNRSIVYSHRTLQGKEIYFVANTSGKPVQFSAAFRVNGLQPELWDALTGETRPLPAFEQSNGRVTVPLQLSANGSAFIVFNNKGVPSARSVAANFPEAQQVAAINGPWQVSFEHDAIKRGPAAPIVMDTLYDWSTAADQRIRYYSGSAIYTTTFSVNTLSKTNQYYIDLGKLSATAKVKVNGKYVGGAWTYPYRVSVKDALIPGKNTLEIEVINTWRNRLIGDHALPEKDRRVWSRINAWNNDDVLQPSGLLGPVGVYLTGR